MFLRRLLISLLLLPGSLLAAELFGTVEDLHGRGYVTDPLGNTTDLSIGQKVYEGQILATASDGEIHLLTVDGNFLGIRPNSQLRIDAYRANRSPDDKIHLSLIKGALRSVTGWIARLRGDAYRIRTATVTIGVRGTDHETIELDHVALGGAPGTYERVYEGVTFVRAKQGEMEVRAGETAFSARDRPDAPRLLNEVPQFIKERVLRLEDKIAQRKANLSRGADTPREGRDSAESHENREAVREERLQEVREKIGDLPPEQRERLRETYRDASPEQRERMERRIIRKMRNRD